MCCRRLQQHPRLRKWNSASLYSIFWWRSATSEKKTKKVGGLCKAKESEVGAFEELGHLFSALQARRFPLQVWSLYQSHLNKNSSLTLRRKTSWSSSENLGVLELKYAKASILHYDVQRKQREMTEGCSIRFLGRRHNLARPRLPKTRSWNISSTTLAGHRKLRIQPNSKMFSRN